MTDILETGDLAFFYRPRVEEEDPHGLDDVQRLQLALRPHGSGGYRLLVVGRKQLPDPAAGGQDRFWGFVDDAGEDAAEVEAHLAAEDYHTATRGERHQPAARPAGEGVYAIARHGDHTHLAYVLELPEEPGEVQEALGIEPQASYVLAVKNPQAPSPPQAGLSSGQQADLPERLQEVFAGRRWADADPVELLDHPGVELLLTAASEEPEAELGIELPAEDEDPASADVFTALRVRRDAHPLEPLFTGHWA